MAQNQKSSETALEIDRLATQLAKDPQSKAFIPLADEYGKAGMWQEAAGVLEDGLKYYPGFITAMVALGRAYDQMGQPAKAKAILEESIKLSPENLRAHRTLIKIYISQGENDSALQSCAVILRANPRDEEALSTQATLGNASKQEGERTVLAALPEFVEPAGQVSALPDLQDSMPDPALSETPRKELAIPEQALKSEPLAIPEAPLADTLESRSPSPHAGVVIQLEAWLRTIKSRRRDRSTANKSHSKTSQ